MPVPALKGLSKKADISKARAEHLWDKAKNIVTKQYGKKHKGYYALVMGITKKMMGLGEGFEEFDLSEEGVAPHSSSAVDNILRNLLMAQRCAHIHHWRVKSLSLHLALGELYEMLTEFADDLAEFYMGMSDYTVNPAQSDPNHFSEQDPLEFVRQLQDVLKELKPTLPQEGALVNKYEELQGDLARIVYKMTNLK